MKRKTSYFEYFRRELVCYFLGHKYKNSARVKTDRYGDMNVYHRCGNPYWRSAASWDLKCKRCRRVEEGWGHYVWYKVIYWACKYSLQDFWWWISVEYDEPGSRAIYKYPVYTIISAICHGIGQWFAQVDDRFHLPSFIWDIPLSIAFWCHDKMWSQNDKESSSVSRSSSV